LERWRQKKVGEAEGTRVDARRLKPPRLKFVKEEASTNDVRGGEVEGAG